MKLHDEGKYGNYFRMSPEVFDKLLLILTPGLSKEAIVRDPIPAYTRLQITLRYLASGDSMMSISFAYRVAHNTVSKIISETCNEIWECLKDSVFFKSNPDNWKSIADDFEKICNFPNCIGAIDGKHVVMQAPANSGSAFYNYKATHSIVLLACSDAHYRFTMVDIGAERRQSDGGIFYNSAMGRGFEESSFQLPPPVALSSNGPLLPAVLVGDEAFPLTKYMMRPYPRSRTLNRRKKIFNYRLSRARRMIESAFGIISSKWRIYRRPINASVSTVKKIVQATCCLHNYMLNHEAKLPSTRRYYSVLSNEERHAISLGLTVIENVGSKYQSQNATRIREQYTTFFEGVGAVPWQWENAMQNNFQSSNNT